MIFNNPKSGKCLKCKMFIEKGDGVIIITYDNLFCVPCSDEVAIKIGKALMAMVGIKPPKSTIKIPFDKSPAPKQPRVPK